MPHFTFASIRIDVYTFDITYYSDGSGASHGYRNTFGPPLIAMQMAAAMGSTEGNAVTANDRFDDNQRDSPDFRAATARSWLLAAATSTSALADAKDARPDCLIVDLEDGVPIATKATARAVAGRWLDAHRSWVRINDIRTCHFKKDIAAIRGRVGLAGVLLAKAETAQDVELLAVELPGIVIVPMVESAYGLTNAVAIARVAPVLRLAFGLGDFLYDTGMASTRASLLHARSHLVVASRAAGRPGPIDGPSAATSDLTADTRYAADLGMSGKLMVRPEDVAQVNHALTPTNDAIEAARSVVDHLGADGRHVKTGADVPRLASAKALIRLAEAWAAPSLGTPRT